MRDTTSTPRHLAAALLVTSLIVATGTAASAVVPSTVQQSASTEVAVMDGPIVPVHPLAGSCGADVRPAAVLIHPVAVHSSAHAAAIPAVIVAAAAWCAKGALASIPMSALEDIANGARPTDYVQNAVFGCLAGEMSWTWRLIPQSVKQRALRWVVRMVAQFRRR